MRAASIYSIWVYIRPIDNNNILIILYMVHLLDLSFMIYYWYIRKKLYHVCILSFYRRLILIIFPKISSCSKLGAHALQPTKACLLL